MNGLGEEKNSVRATRVSSVVLLIIFLTLALALVALILAASMYVSEPVTAGLLAIMGLAGVALSAYVILQLRRRATRLSVVIPPIMTTVECKKCGNKNVREFQRGDYVFKDLDQCQKCNDKMMITAIYREVKEKEKEQLRV
jgi:RNase P subunit RPR2